MNRSDIILKRLMTLHPNVLIDLKLDRMERILAEMGHPEHRLPPVIHVAGTNGKGSTIAFLRAFLEAAGKKVHVYTSPNLVAFRERIRLAGELVSNRQLAKTLAHCETVNDGRPITYFEITTAAAFHLFAETPADYLLLEVGLGGRFDATNVIDHPFGTIITPVSIDHVQFLGNTIEKIATEKAGILKRGAPAVIARQADEGHRAIDREARKLGVSPFYAGEGFDGYAQDGRLIYQDEDGLLDLPPPALLGPFQYTNAAVAIAALRHFNLPVSEQQISEGLRTVKWPGRMTPLTIGKLRDLLPSTSELWLDGSHNEAGGAVLAEALRDMQAKSPRPLVLVMGNFANKDAKGFLKHFGDLPEMIYTIRIHGERASWAARQLADFAGELGYKTKPMRSIESALGAAADIPNARVVICGGLHLAGDVLRRNGTPPR